VVVVGDEMKKSLPRIWQVLRLHALPKLLAHGLPKALALAEGLRVMTSRHDMADPFTLEKPLEFSLSAPREVLGTLVGQDFLGLPKPTHAIEQCRHDELARWPEL
jgi:hypothetical protein